MPSVLLHVTVQSRSPWSPIRRVPVSVTLEFRVPNSKACELLGLVKWEPLEENKQTKRGEERHKEEEDVKEEEEETPPGPDGDFGMPDMPPMQVGTHDIISYHIISYLSLIHI